MGKHHNESDDDSLEERRSRSAKKDDKHRHRSSHSRKRRRRREDDDLDNSSSSATSSNSEEDNKRRRKDRKGHKKESKKKSKKEESRKSDSRRERRKKDKKRHRDDDDDDDRKERRQRNNEQEFETIAMSRGYTLADSLCNLFEHHPALVDDLPIMLIQLARGTSFNLHQMTDGMASQALQQVFQSLMPMGVEQDETGCWVWKSPDGVGASSRRPGSELVLLKVVRSLLDQIGITIEAVTGYESAAVQQAQLNLGDSSTMLLQDNSGEGPLLHVTNEASSDDDDEEVGPSLPTSRVVGPTLPPEAIKALAHKRARELTLATTGVDIGASKEDAGGREEWMLTPGKVDFLQAIQKPSNATTGRKFENKKQSSTTQTPTVVNPAVQAELKAILKAHAEARGPSLMEQHRMKQAAEKEAAAVAAAQGGQQKEWKWSRDKDLDADRRVDKSALQQVFGGATDGLDKKFQGGFR